MKIKKYINEIYPALARRKAGLRIESLLSDEAGCFRNFSASVFFIEFLTTPVDFIPQCRA